LNFESQIQYIEKREGCFATTTEAMDEDQGRVGMRAKDGYISYRKMLGCG
jgi:hypothetical protein